MRYESRATLVGVTLTHVNAPPPGDSPSGESPGESATSEEGRRARTRNVWRIGTPLVVLLSGSLFAISAANSDGTDLRPGRYSDLASLVQTESDAYAQLQSRASDIKAQVDDLTAAVEDRQVRRKRNQVARLREPANVQPVTGPGVTIVLSDAPIEKLDAVVNEPQDQLDAYVVHQQDIQAVVNALWAGGAEALTIQGQRVVSTTGIRCSASAVQLQGVPYPQPYRIQAVGLPTELLAALDADPDVTAFRTDAADADIGVGFAAEVDPEIDAPAYDGLLDITYAKPVR